MLSNMNSNLVGGLVSDNLDVLGEDAIKLSRLHVLGTSKHDDLKKTLNEDVL